MDALLLSRIQFGFVISCHIIFPAFTIGLASWLAFLEWRWLRTRDALWRDLYFFWLKIFAVSFGMGVVSGIVMKTGRGRKRRQRHDDGTTARRQNDSHGESNSAVGVQKQGDRTTTRRKEQGNEKGRLPGNTDVHFNFSKISLMGCVLRLSLATMPEARGIWKERAKLTWRAR